MEVLDRLRNVSRNAYLTDIAFNSVGKRHYETGVGIFQLTKLIDVLEELKKQYKNSKSISSLAQKLVVSVDKKIQVIKDYAVIAYQVDNISRKTPIGVHPLTLLEDYTKSHEMSEITSKFKTPGSTRNSRGLTKGGTMDLSKMKDGSIFQMAVASVTREPVTRTSDVDLRRVAIANSFKGLKQLGDDRPGWASSGTADIDIEKSADATDNSFLGADMSSSIQVVHSTSFHRDSRSIASNHLSKSLVLPRRKPFDKTVGEEQIEAIYKNVKRQQPARRASFEEELMMDHQFEDDMRLNNSCALDYALETSYYRAKKMKRANSFVMHELVAVYDENSAVKPKK